MNDQVKAVPFVERSILLSLLTGLIVAVPAAMAVARLCTLIAELLYRWRPHSVYAQYIEYSWFDPGVRGDILLTFIVALGIHFLLYPVLTFRQSKRFHLRYLLFGNSIWVGLIFLTSFGLTALGPMESPL